MKYNLDYYKSDIRIYADTYEEKYENEIKLVMQNTEKTDYETSITKKDSCFAFNELSSIKANILKWYDFEKESSVLEIGTFAGIITEMLCDRCKNVTSISFDKNISEVVKDKLNDRENLEIIVGSLDDIVISKKFDYIVITGCLEALKNYYSKSIDEFFKYMNSLLEENGKLIFAINNKIAVKYISGANSEYKNEKLYTRKELISIMERNGFESYNFYYPLPDYKITNAIFSDRFLPDYTSSKLMYNINYLDDCLVTGNELTTIKRITKNGNFVDFANSFLIITGKQEKCKFISYNNLRKQEFRLIVKMFDDYVEKTVENEKASYQIEKIDFNIDLLKKNGFKVLDRLEDGKIISQYSSLESLNNHILKMYREKSRDEVLKVFDTWKNEVISKLEIEPKEKNIENNIFKIAGIEVDEGMLNSFNITKYGLFDLVFENVFISPNKELFFYDQEWMLKYVPIEFIMYRAINNIYGYDFGIEKIIPKIEVLKYLEIEEYINVFDKLENYIQKYVLDENRVELYSKSYGNRILAEEIKNKIEEYQKLSVDCQELYSENVRLNEEMNSTVNEVARIKNSFIWKIYNKFKGGK